MSNFDDFLAEQLATDSEFADEYNRLAPERAAMIAIAQARADVGMTQDALARTVGMQTSSISRIENGSSNPTVKTLARLASGMGKRLEIRLV